MVMVKSERDGLRALAAMREAFVLVRVDPGVVERRAAVKKTIKKGPRRPPKGGAR